MNSPIHIGIIGLGQIGKIHLKNYAKIPGVKVVAVADKNLEQAEQTARDFGIEMITEDFHDLLDRDDIEAVDVALHNNLHLPVSVEALRSGKHVYCEKPMAGSYCDALTMLNTAQEEKRNLSIQLTSIFSKEVRAVLELIKHDMLGKVYHARSVGFRRRMRPYVDGYGTASFVQKGIAGGGALFDMGIYHIASLLYLIGNPKVKTISGQTYQETEMDPARRLSSNYDVEEFATGFVRLDENISLDIIESWAVHMDQLGGSLLLGSKGGVRLDPFGFFQNIGDLEINSTADLDQFLWRRDSLYQEDLLWASPQHHWVAALRGLVPLAPTAEIALNTMLISEGIYLSNALGREVTAKEVIDSSRSAALILS